VRQLKNQTKRSERKTTRRKEEGEIRSLIVEGTGVQREKCKGKGVLMAGARLSCFHGKWGFEGPKGMRTASEKIEYHN